MGRALSVLLLGAQELADIRAAIERARDRPLPMDMLRRAGLKDKSVVVKLADRVDDHYRPQSEMVQLGSYRVSISFEQQPAGLIRHLSISAPKPGTLPNRPVLEMVAEAFGFTLPLADGHAWLEEFDPGHFAINLVQLESA